MTTCEGTASLKVGQFTAGKRIPTGNPFFSAEIYVSVQPLTFSLGGNFTYDESKPVPKSGGGSLSAGTSVSATLEGVFGINGEAENNYGGVVAVTGATGIEATGSLGFEERSIVAKSRFNLGELHVTGQISVQAGDGFEAQLAGIDRVLFPGKCIPENGEPHEYVLYSW